jgi:hypothetical protein
MAHPVFIPVVVVLCAAFTLGMRSGHRFFDSNVFTGDKNEKDAKKRQTRKMSQVLVAVIWIIGLGVSIKLAI